MAGSERSYALGIAVLLAAALALVWVQANSTTLWEVGRVGYVAVEVAQRWTWGGMLWLAWRLGRVTAVCRSRAWRLLVVAALVVLGVLLLPDFYALHIRISP